MLAIELLFPSIILIIWGLGAAIIEKKDEKQAEKETGNHFVKWEIKNERWY